MDFYTNLAMLTILSYYKRKIEPFCVKTRENTKVPSNHSASQQLQMERSGDLMKGTSLTCCNDQASGTACHMIALYISHMSPQVLARAYFSKAW